MTITHISQLPEWAKRNHSTGSQKFFMDLLNIHERPENQDLEIPMAIQILRTTERVSQKLDRIEANTSKSESFLHGLANIFKFGAGEAEKTYPSKKK